MRLLRKEAFFVKSSKFNLYNARLEVTKGALYHRVVFGLQCPTLNIFILSKVIEHFTTFYNVISLIL